MKLRKPFFTTLAACLTLSTLLFFAAPAIAGDDENIFEAVRISNARAGQVSELGEMLAHFKDGQLRQGDIITFTLPSGFIWTTADIESDEQSAKEKVQTTEEWNTITETENRLRYGTSNYVQVPAFNSGEENGLYRGSTPTLELKKISNREVMLQILEEPVPGRECYLYLYLERVYVPDDYSGDVALAIDAPTGSVGDNGVAAEIACQDVPTLYSGMQPQKVGTLIITEAEAGSLPNGYTLTLQLPEHARWVKLDEASNKNLSLTAGSTRNNDRIAVFKFSGNSSSPATLKLENLKVNLQPAFTGDLLVKVGGTAGLDGQLNMARVVAPVAVFTVGKTQFINNQVEKTMDAAPYVKDGRTYLPVRFAARALGVADAQITWNTTDQSIIIRNGPDTIKLTIGSKHMTINEKTVLMDAAPEVVEPGRTMLPIRWLAEALGAEINWEPTTESVYVVAR